jgi:hypothetical protein
MVSVWKSKEIRLEVEAAQPTFEDLFRKRLDDQPPHKSRKEEPHAYASEALGCARAIGFRLLRVPESSGFGTSTLINFYIGRILHQVIGEIIVARNPTTELEVNWDLGECTGRADAVYKDAEGLVIGEFKTMSNASFVRALKYHKPSDAHMMQASLGALAIGTDRVHIIYVSKGAPSNQQTLLEWLIKADLGAAEFELERMKGIVSRAKQGILPDRTGPFGEEYAPAFTKWPCQYCSHRTLCDQLGPGDIPWDTVATLINT